AADVFRTVSKCGTGFSDAELAALPARLAPLRRPERPARVDAAQEPDVWFEPGLVLEILSAELTLSPHYTAGWGLVKEDAGLAMRFPRFTGRWRDDKSAQDATTIGELVDLYRTAQRAPAAASGPVECARGAVVAISSWEPGLMSLPFPEPTAPASSRAEVFLRYLEYFRSCLVTRLDGLPSAELRASRLPSGWAPIELLKH